MIAFNCPRCKGQLTRAENEAGWKTACPSCGQRIQIPQLPRSKDQTLLGELQGPGESRTLLGELSVQPAQPAQPALPTAIVVQPQSQSTSDPWTFDEQAATPSRRHYRTKSGGGWLKTIGLLLGGIVVLWLGCAGVMYQTHQPKPRNTEAEARLKLKKALDRWIAGDSKQAITAKHPDIEFVDPDLGDTYILLRHDIGTGWEMEREWRIEVAMVFRNKAGGEIRLTREYLVKPPNEKNVTSIHVSIAELGPRTKTQE